MTLNNQQSYRLLKAEVNVVNVLQKSVSFEDALKLNTSNNIDNKKTAYAQVIVLAPWVQAALATTGAIAITWLVDNITKAFNGEPISKDLTTLQKNQLSKVSLTLLDIPGSQNLTTRQRNALKANIIMINTDGNENKEGNRSNQIDPNGTPPKTQKPAQVKVDSSTDLPNGWIKTNLGYAQLKELPRGKGIRIFGTHAKYIKVKAQAHTLQMFDSFFKKIQKIEGVLTKPELSTFNYIKTKLSPFLVHPTCDTISKILTPQELSKIVVLLRSILKKYNINTAEKIIILK